MAKINLSKPILIMMHGFPGSGKTHFGRQLSDSIRAAHINSDRIRGELFDKPRYDGEENQVVEHLMMYMAEEFLSLGVSVIYDNDAISPKRRKLLEELAKRHHSVPLLIWFQIDRDTAYHRTTKRDRRRVDDKYARSFTKQSFDAYITSMQNPKSSEEYIVLSGKHSFQMQRSALVKRLYDHNLINADTASSNVIKPGMVNLVPGREDLLHRNIRIR